MSQKWTLFFWLFVAYFLTGYWGLSLPAVGTQITLIWLPTGIAVACLYRWGYRFWPSVTIAAVSLNMVFGVPFVTALGIAVGNTVATVIVAWLLHRMKFQSTLRRWQDIVLLAIAAPLGMLISATNGILVTKLFGGTFSSDLVAWLCWWIGDSLGVIIAAPLALSACRAEFVRIRKRGVELALWLMLTLTVAWGVFVFNDNVGEPALALAFVPLPLIAWATLRFRATGTSLAIVLLSTVAAWGTAHQTGIFYRVQPFEQLLLLASYMVTTITLGWLISSLHFAQVKAIDIQLILEEALREASTGVLLTDSERYVTYVNAGFTRLTGFTEKEMIGKRLGEIVELNVKDKDSKARDCDRNTTGYLDAEFLDHRKDGTDFWNAAIVMPLLSSHGEQAGFLCIQRDVTIRKEAELAMRQSESRLQTILNLEPECVKILDSDGRLVEMNPAGLAMIQAKSLDQVAGACMAEMIAESHRAMFCHMHRQVLAGASVNYEFPAFTLDGRELWLESHAVPYRDNEGRIIGQLAVTRDMTQRKIAEDELRASDARYRQLFDSNPQPMWVYDLETLAFLAVNGAAIQHYGYTRDEFLAMTIKDIRPSEDIPALLETIKHIPAGIDKAGIWRHRLRSGTLINVEVTSHSLHIDGRLADLVLANDITERLRIEERLRTSLSEKTAMLKEIHHRVKNNLQIIMSLLNLQAGQTGDLAALGVLQESQNRVRSMSLVHETLYQSENLASIDMRDYLDSLVKYLFRSYGMDSSRIRIRIEIDDLSLDLHQAMPFGLIINELISNSLKYAFPGNRSGEISIQQRSMREHFHTFVIADDGIGLPEPLNLKALRTLGLQLVHDLTQQLSGTLTVVESPQLQFSISFPMEVQQEMTA